MSSIDLRAAPKDRCGFSTLRLLWDGPRSAAGNRVAFAAITILGVAALAVLFFNNPSAQGHWFPPCPIYALSGWYCPGCGSTRGLYQLLHGHLAAAFRMNPLMVLSIPYFAYAYLTYAARIAFPGASQANQGRAPTKAHWIWSLLALILLYWVLRNVQAYPFTLLAPH